jgi:hypothetical protein
MNPNGASPEKGKDVLMKPYQSTGISRVKRNGVWEHLPIRRWVEERQKWGNKQYYITLPAHIRKVSMSQVSHSHMMEKGEKKRGKNHNKVSV